MKIHPKFDEVLTKLCFGVMTVGIYNEWETAGKPVAEEEPELGYEGIDWELAPFSSVKEAKARLAAKDAEIAVLKFKFAVEKKLADQHFENLEKAEAEIERLKVELKSRGDKAALLKMYEKHVAGRDEELKKQDVRIQELEARLAEAKAAGGSPKQWSDAGYKALEEAGPQPNFDEWGRRFVEQRKYRREP